MLARQWGVPISAAASSHRSPHRLVRPTRSRPPRNRKTSETQNNCMATPATPFQPNPPPRRPSPSKQPTCLRRQGAIAAKIPTWRRTRDLFFVPVVPIKHRTRAHGARGRSEHIATEIHWTGDDLGSNHWSNPKPEDQTDPGGVDCAVLLAQLEHSMRNRRKKDTYRA